MIFRVHPWKSISGKNDKPSAGPTGEKEYELLLQDRRSVIRSTMTQQESYRVDKWLWEVRLFKTRSLATEACKAGKIKMDGNSVKAAKELKPGDIITVSLNPLFKTVKVIQFPKSRLGAKLVPEYMEDLTPQEEYDRVKLIEAANSEYRQRGVGRPTKKSRRMIDRLKEDKEDW